MIVFKAIAIIVLVMLNAFFVAAEFALVRVRSGQIELKVREGSRTAGLAKRILGNLDVYLSACQLGITVESLVLGAVGEPFMAEYVFMPLFALLNITSEALLHGLSFVGGIMVITFLHITLGEQAPKMMAIQRPRRTSMFVAYPLHWFYWVCYPLVHGLNWCSNRVLRVCGLETADHGQRAATEGELRQIMAESALGGHVTKRESGFMENVLDMRAKVARQIMLPRTVIIHLLTENSTEENLEIVRRTQHTRYPLCTGGLDDIAGYIHIRDLIPVLSGHRKIGGLSELVREVLFLPETVTADRLLTEFQAKKIHLAMLVDEYGATVGMVTLEDVLEEVFGEIQDEFDDETPEIQKVGPGLYLVEALCPLDKFQKAFSLSLDQAEHARVDTVAGLVFSALGHLPSEGETLTLNGFEVTVKEIVDQRITKLLFKKPRPEQGQGLGARD